MVVMTILTYRFCHEKIKKIISKTIYMQEDTFQQTTVASTKTQQEVVRGIKKVSTRTEIFQVI